MTYPPPPGGWQDPAGGQPTYIDPVSGQPAAVSPAPTQPYPAYPSYPTDQPQYPQPGYPTDSTQYAQPAQPGYPTDQPQYAQPVPQAYPAYSGYPSYTPVMANKTNGLAIGSLVTSIASVVICGGVLGIVGAILGHVARRQIRERNEEGAGLALAGIIVGWISFGLSVILVIVFVSLAIWAGNQDPYS